MDDRNAGPGLGVPVGGDERSDNNASTIPRHSRVTGAEQAQFALLQTRRR